MRDGSLEDNDNLPAPDVLAREIVDELRATLDQVMPELERVLEDEWLATWNKVHLRFWIYHGK